MASASPATARRVRPRGLVWGLLPGGFVALVGFTLFFDSLYTTQTEPGIERYLSYAILIFAGFLLGIGTIVWAVQPHRCGQCDAKIKRAAAFCPSCKATFP